MHPVLLALGRFEIYSYGVLIAVGGVLSSLFWRNRWRKIGFKKEDDVWTMVNAILLGGFLGGRVLFIFEYTAPFSREFWQTAVSLNRGFSVMGAFAGVVAAIVWTARRSGISFLRVMDYVCQAAPLWHTFGRLGCFMAGCCFGRPTNEPWGVAFTDPRAMVEPWMLGRALHPTQLYEAAGDFLIAAALYFFVLPGVEKGTLRRGAVCAAYFLSYGVLRFVLEFYRGDTVPLWGGLTAAQGAGAALVLAAAGVWFAGGREACSRS